MGGGGDKAPGQYMGWWGNLGSPPQKGITTYALSPNRQRPLAGTFDSAIYNTFRRSSAQVLYFIPPFVIAYATMQWAIEKNEYYNSKPGRKEAAEAEKGGE